VAFATAPAATIGRDDTDRPLHDAACTAAGIELDHRIWSTPGVPWEEYDLVVVRSTWDYVHRVDDFLAWIDHTDRLGTLQNPAPVVAWNLDKRYLLDLADVGVPVISTRVCTDAADVANALAPIDGEVVVKPVVSAGSWRTGRFAPGDSEAPALAEAILGEGTPVLVQPAVASRKTSGTGSRPGMTTPALRLGKDRRSDPRGPCPLLRAGVCGFFACVASMMPIIFRISGSGH
jgi:hypothetical protein